MAAPLVLIGTGTEVGKTYVAERLLRAFAAGGSPAIGYKPVESGVLDESAETTDIARLRAASTFHVKPSLRSFTFPEPVSPHLAARLAGGRIDIPLLYAEIARAAASPALLLVELPGGAFSPLSDGMSGAEFARGIPSARVLLVASDRLGVLHDVAATSLACAALGLPLRGLVLSAPATPDASTGRNAAELSGVTSLPLLGELPRATASGPLGPGDPIHAVARLLV